MDRVRELLALNMKIARKRLWFSQQKLAESCDISTEGSCLFGEAVKTQDEVVQGKRRWSLMDV